MNLNQAQATTAPITSNGNSSNVSEWTSLEQWKRDMDVPKLKIRQNEGRMNANGKQVRPFAMTPAGMVLVGENITHDDLNNPDLSFNIGWDSVREVWWLGKSEATFIAEL